MYRGLPRLERMEWLAKFDKLDAQSQANEMSLAGIDLSRR